MDCPPSLLGVRTYFLRADELKLSRPYVAHRLRLFAVELAMKVPLPARRQAAIVLQHVPRLLGRGRSNYWRPAPRSRQVKGPDAGRFLMGQLEALEQEKAAGIPPPMIRKRGLAGSDKPVVVAAAPAAAAPAASAAAAAPSSAGPKTGEIGSMDAALDAAETAAPAPRPSPLDMDAALDAAEASLAQASVGPPAARSMDAMLDAAEDQSKGPRATAGTVLAPAGEEEAIRACGLDLYERGRVADRPGTFPSPAVAWSVTDAPRVAQCLHASAVVLDALKLFSPDLPTDLKQFQAAAHRRSAQLASQLAHAFKTPPCIPLDWVPADALAPPKPPPVKTEAPPHAPPPPPIIFPAVPGRG